MDNNLTATIIILYGCDQINGSQYVQN
jgi:hypothetical protein